MEKRQSYYHGLAGGIPFWYQKEVLDTSIKTLEKNFRTRWNLL